MDQPICTACGEEFLLEESDKEKLRNHNDWIESYVCPECYETGGPHVV